MRSFLGVLVSRGLILSARASLPGRLQIPPHVAWTESEGLVVVTNLHHGERFTLSDTASRIWTLVAAGISRQEAITAVAEEFPDAPASFATEIASLLDSLWPRARPAPVHLVRSRLSGRGGEESASRGSSPPGLALAPSPRRPNRRLRRLLENRSSSGPGPWKR